MIQTRTSKDVEVYTHYTRTVATLEPAADSRMSLAPGQGIQYVIVDEDRDSLEQVRLVDEIDGTTSYDQSFSSMRAV